MRHIPEDELHAYLDQGLSRTQCVEIESHLAACPSCQALRDGIAAMRDRTTALLARLAPPRGFRPAFEVLRARAADAADRRRRRLHLTAWAASLVAAVGLGWGASSIARSGPRARPETPAVAAVSAPSGPSRAVQPREASSEAGEAQAADPQVARAPSRPSAGPSAPRVRVAAMAGSPRDSDAGARTGRPAPNPAAAESAAVAKRAATLSVLNPTPALELTRLERPSGAAELELGGMWRTVSWDGAKAEAGERLPHIDGLPVVQVQVQSGEQSARPVMVVAQQLSSGQVIRTIEGPATDVSHLLSRRAMAEVDSLFLPADSSVVGTDASHAMAMQRGDRMLAITGNLPSDSLRAMIRRLNAEMRSK
ncbi:MAG: zf-HC2 domain-containing protein [Gemmatimonadales bacterium]